MKHKTKHRKKQCTIRESGNVWTTRRSRALEKRLRKDFEKSKNKIILEEKKSK